MTFNRFGITAIYRFQMMRFVRTMGQSIVSPVITTSLYFVVFGAAIGSRISNIDGINYGAFIVPGMLMLTMLNQSLSNASFGIYFEKFTGTIYETLSAPLSPFEILLGFVGAAATKSIIVGLIIFVTATFFVEFEIKYPIIMVLFLLLTAIAFSMFGFIIGLWADNFEKLQLIPMLIIYPLVFLGGSFYSINMLPEFWQQVSYFNPVLYLINGFRWSFYGVSDINIGICLLVISVFMLACLAAVIWIFKTGWGLKN